MWAPKAASNPRWEDELEGDGSGLDVCWLWACVGSIVTEYEQRSPLHDTHHCFLLPGGTAWRVPIMPAHLSVPMPVDVHLHLRLLLLHSRRVKVGIMVPLAEGQSGSGAGWGKAEGSVVVTWGRGSL